MTTGEIIVGMLDQLTDLETAGIRIVIADKAVRQMFEIYKSSGLRQSPDRTSRLLAGAQDKRIWVRMADLTGKKQLYDGEFPVTKIGRIADLVNRQAGFALSHPEMFAGCEMDF